METVRIRVLLSVFWPAQWSDLLGFVVLFGVENGELEVGLNIMGFGAEVEVDRWPPKSFPVVGEGAA